MYCRLQKIREHHLHGVLGGIVVRRILFTGLLFLLLYFSLSTEYMKVWFVVLWGVIGLIAIFTMEAKS